MDGRRSFGYWLKERRAALDLTQAELADQVGCSTMTIRKIEADERRPSKQISERLADVLAIADDDRPIFLAFARRIIPSHQAQPDHLSDLLPTSNLMSQPTPFIGRESELRQITERLADPTCRLLTLVGPGGIGKTRLALQAAANQIGEYADGVFFVSLTPVGAITFIASAIASALQLSFYGQDDPEKQVVNYLRGKRLLLVMDNYEHLLGGITILADMLANAPHLKIMVTSRERLNMQEEWILPVEGLPYPDQSANGDINHYDAVELFVQTARRIQPGFEIAGNQAGVIDICRAVDGMPLGIELAATWLRAMPCSQIAEQIRHDLDFLVTPLRNVPERHRSLRAVFEHSWGLLSEVERDVVMKLSVFRGGIDLEAAEQVAGASLRVLAGLVDKSLVRVHAAGRYEMHELLRQFAADKLLQSDEAVETQDRHFQFFLTLAEHLEERLFGPQQLAALDRLEIELDNFRTALHRAGRIGDVASGLRLAGALGWFWNRRTHWNEGRQWLVMFLVAAHDTAVQVRAKAVHHILELSWELGDPGFALKMSEEAINLVQIVGDTRIKAWLLTSMGFVERSETGLRRNYLEKALALFRQLGDQWGTCEVLGRLAVAAMDEGDFSGAASMLVESIQLSRRAADRSVLGFSLCLMATAHWYEGKINVRTEQMYRESLGLFRELRYLNGISWALRGLGEIAYLQGEYNRANLYFQQSLTLAQQVSNKWYVGYCLISLADIARVQKQPERSVRILGAVSSLVNALFAGNTHLDELDRRDYERIKAAARAHLDADTFEAAFAEGQRMTLDEAVIYALADVNYGEVE